MHREASYEESVGAGSYDMAVPVFVRQNQGERELRGLGGRDIIVVRVSER
jgi:hypothetical protein